MTNFFISIGTIIIQWLPLLLFLAIFIPAAIFYFKRKKAGEEKFLKRVKLLILIALIARIFYAGLQTFLLYYLWLQDEMGKLLVQIPVSRSAAKDLVWKPIAPLFEYQHGYFAFYALGRFWLNVFISIIAAAIFYIILLGLKKYRERFFEKGEAELGLLMALILIWPNFAVFVPLVFISVVLVSIYKKIALKEAYATLGAPFLLAGFLSAVIGGLFLSYLNWGVLAI